MFFCLLICAFAQAQEYAWTRDSSGVWNLDIYSNNYFGQNEISLDGEELLFTSHVPENYNYASLEDTRMLLVSKVLPNGEPQVIRKMNFYGGNFILRRYQNHYYILTEDLNVRRDRQSTVIYEYDSTWKCVGFTRVRLPRGQFYYYDFVPVKNQQFYLLSFGSFMKSKKSNGFFVVKTGRRGRIENRRFFPENMPGNLSVRNDSVFFSLYTRKVDSCRSNEYKYAIVSYACDSILRGDGVDQGIKSFYDNETNLLNSGRVVKKYFGPLDELTLFNSHNDSLRIWTAEYKWEIKQVIPADSNRFAVLFEVGNNSDNGSINKCGILVLFDMNMMITRLWQHPVLSKKDPFLFRQVRLYYSAATKSIHLIYSKTNDQGNLKLCFEAVPLPE